MLTACCLIGGGDLLASARVAGPKLTITFEFGKNPSQNCPNSGFCRIKAGGSLRGHDGTVGEIQFNEEEGAGPAVSANNAMATAGVAGLDKDPPVSKKGQKKWTTANDMFKRGKPNG